MAVPCSVLYMPPEQRIDLVRGPFAYDVYSAGLVWVCAAVPALGGSEEALYDWRVALRAHRHDAQAWRRAAASPPADGWVAAYGWKGSGWEDVGRGGSDGKAAGHGGGVQQQQQMQQAQTQQQQTQQQSQSQMQQSQQQQQHGWELLASMLALDPARRPSAAAALLGPYLNEHCAQPELPMPAAEPWTLEALISAAGAGAPRTLAAEECSLPMGAQ